MGINCYELQMEKNISTIINNCNEFRMDTEKLAEIIMSNNWGTNLAHGDHFYRLLFRLEKQSTLEVEEIKSLFASYKRWKLEMDELTKECHGNSTMEDRKAIMYGETLCEDIIQHVEMIIMSVKCNKPEFVQNLREQAEKGGKMAE